MEAYQEELIALRSGRKAPERSGEYWSKEDLETLQNLFWEGVNLSEIAIRLGRNEVATYQQLAKSGLLSGQCRARKRAKRPAKAECLCPSCGVTDCRSCGKEGAIYAGGV